MGLRRHSARWLFSTHELEVERETVGGLAAFIRDGGREGRTRTEIYRDYFKGNRKAAEIDAELVPLVHDGVVIEIKDETRGRTITRYIHRDLRIDILTNNAGQRTNRVTYPYAFTIQTVCDPLDSSIRRRLRYKKPSDLVNTFNKSIRKPRTQDGYELRSTRRTHRRDTGHDPRCRACSNRCAKRWSLRC